MAASRRAIRQGGKKIGSLQDGAAVAARRPRWLGHWLLLSSASCSKPPNPFLHFISTSYRFARHHRHAERWFRCAARQPPRWLRKRRADFNAWLGVKHLDLPAAVSTRGFDPAGRFTSGLFGDRAWLPGWHHRTAIWAPGVCFSFHPAKVYLLRMRTNLQPSAPRNSRCSTAGPAWPTAWHSAVDQTVDTARLDPGGRRRWCAHRRTRRRAAARRGTAYRARAADHRDRHPAVVRADADTIDLQLGHHVVYLSPHKKRPWRGAKPAMGPVLVRTPGPRRSRRLRAVGARPCTELNSAEMAKQDPRPKNTILAALIATSWKTRPFSNSFRFGPWLGLGHLRDGFETEAISVVVRDERKLGDHEPPKRSLVYL